MAEFAQAFGEKYGKAPPNGKPYSVPVTGSAKPGRTAIYRHYAIGDGPLLATLDPNVTTAHEAFEAGCRSNPKGNCLGWRERDKVKNTWGPYKWWSYETVRQKRLDIGA